MSNEASRKAAGQWQSQLLVAVILPVCVVIVTGYTARTWTGLTQIAWAASLLLGAAAWVSRAATSFAAATGGVLAAAIFLAGIRPHSADWLPSTLLPLLTLLLLTFAATRFGRPRKQQLGIAQDARGRNAAQVIANLGTAGLLGSGILAISLVVRAAHQGSCFGWELGRLTALGSVALIAALAEATADTLSSELGEVLGGEPRLITTGRRVAPGTDGAISIAGTVAGVAGAALLVLVAMAAKRLSGRDAVAAMAGACGGLFFDSLLGAIAEGPRGLNNDAVNFLSTLAAALVALAMA